MLRPTPDIKKRQINTDDIKSFSRDGLISYYRLLSEYVRMCPGCKRQYDGKALIPHKINGCFHIMCEQCLENKTHCPICNTKFDGDMIIKAYIPRVKNKFPRLCAQNCSIHNKDFEWFCEKCSCYLCIKCRTQHSEVCQIEQIIPLSCITSETKDLLDKKIQKDFSAFSDIYNNMLASLGKDKKSYLDINKANEAKFVEAKESFRQNFEYELSEAKVPALQNINADYREALADNEDHRNAIHSQTKYLKEQLAKLTAIKQQYDKSQRGATPSYMYLIENTDDLEELESKIKNIRDERLKWDGTKKLTADYDYEIYYGRNMDLEKVLCKVIYYDEKDWLVKNYHAAI